MGALLVWDYIQTENKKGTHKGCPYKEKAPVTLSRNRGLFKGGMIQ